METVAVACPYCESETTASIPNETTVTAVLQSYETGIQGKDNLVEVGCAEGHHFGVTHR